MRVTSSLVCRLAAANALGLYDLRLATDRLLCWREPDGAELVARKGADQAFDLVNLGIEVLVSRTDAGHSLPEPRNNVMWVQD